MNHEGSWFHCGRCGHVYGGEEKDLCPACGKSPVVPEAEMAYVMAGGHLVRRERREPSKGSESPSTESSGSADSKRRKRKSKSTAMLWFAVGWMGLLGLIAGGVAVVKLRSPKSEESESMGIGDSSEKSRMINEAYVKCREALVGYWSAAAPETRAEHTLNPDQTLRRMVGSGISLSVMKDPQVLKLEWIDSFETSEGVAIASVWTEPDIGRIEAVFRKNDEGAWKLDWVSFLKRFDRPISRDDQGRDDLA